MNKISNKGVRITKTKNKKAKRLKLADIFINKYISTESLNKDDNKVSFHNMRSIMRSIRNKALGMITKKDALHEYYNKDERKQQNRKSRKSNKIDLHQIAMKYEEEDNN